MTQCSSRAQFRSVQYWTGHLAKPVEGRLQRSWVDIVRTCPILDTYFPESRAFELTVNAPMIARCRNRVVLSRLQENRSASEGLVQYAEIPAAAMTVSELMPAK